MGVFCIGFIAYATWGYLTLNAAKVHGPYYHRIAMNKDLIGDILPPPEYIIESFTTVLHTANALGDGEETRQVSEMLDQLVKLNEEYETRHNYWMAGEVPRGANQDSTCRGFLSPGDGVLSNCGKRVHSRLPQRGS